MASLTLRSPANARKAVEAGAVDMAALIMGKYPCAAHLQRQGCQMLRNLAVRNPENRQVISLSLSIYLSLLSFFFNTVCNTRGSFNTCLSKNQLLLKIPCRKFSYSEIFQTILDFSFTEILLFEMGFFL